MRSVIAGGPPGSGPGSGAGNLMGLKNRYIGTEGMPSGLLGKPSNYRGFGPQSGGGMGTATVDLGEAMGRATAPMRALTRVIHQQRQATELSAFQQQGIQSQGIKMGGVETVAKKKAIGASITMGKSLKLLALSLAMLPVKSFIQGILEPFEPLLEIFEIFGELVGIALYPLMEALLEIFIALIPTLEVMLTTFKPIIDIYVLLIETVTPLVLIWGELAVLFVELNPAFITLKFSIAILSPYIRDLAWVIGKVSDRMAQFMNVMNNMGFDNWTSSFLQLGIGVIVTLIDIKNAIGEFFDWLSDEANNLLDVKGHAESLIDKINPFD